jgi:hypothetical protein
MMQAQLLGLADRAAGLFGVFRDPLSTTSLIELAQRRTQLTDFGDRSFEAALGVLVQSYEDEAELSTFGRMVARWDAERFLSNLLLLREAETRDAAITEQPIRQPIFVTGLPRSGTTFLHALLESDPSNRVVQCWETIYPYPPRSGAGTSVEARRKKVDRQLALFARLTPEVKAMHPLSADTPQECTEITGHTFASHRFDTTHHVPSYRRWLDRIDLTGAYRFHRRFLQHLQRRKGEGIWVLKCPDHVFALQAVRAVYPDARFVFLHRDPVEVLASVAKLTEVLRRPFARRIDRPGIGQQVAERWAEGAAILIDEVASSGIASDRVAHLKFGALTQDPLNTVAGLYERFGMTLAPEAETAIRAYVTARPNGGYGPRNARLEDYGLDAATERVRFRHYISCFGL